MAPRDSINVYHAFHRHIGHRHGANVMSLAIVVLMHCRVDSATRRHITRHYHYCHDVLSANIGY